MKKIKYLLILLASLSQLLFLPIFGNAEMTSEEILGYTNEGEVLGIASSFGLFVKEDCGFNGCDLEARLACGGNCNIGEFEWYSVKNTAPAASVICQGDYIQNFDIGERIFALGTNTEAKINSKNIYYGDWIDFDKEFSQLIQLSKQFSMENNGSVERDSNWNQQINFIGNSEVNYFEIDTNKINIDQYCFNFKVPKDSYSIVNVKGSKLCTQLYGCSYAGQRINSNSDPLSSHILFNFIGTDLTIEGSGTLYGTVLAPLADVHDSIVFGAHCTGSIIANSFYGGIEIGGVTFDRKEEYNDSESSILQSESQGANSINSLVSSENRMDSSTIISSTQESTIPSSRIISGDSSQFDIDPQSSRNLFISSSSNDIVSSSGTRDIKLDSIQEGDISSCYGRPIDSDSLHLDTSTQMSDPVPATGEKMNPMQFFAFIVILAILALSCVFDKIKQYKEKEEQLKTRERDKKEHL